MAEIYRLYTEADYDAITKVTGVGQAQAWDASSVLGSAAGGVKFTIAGGTSNIVVMKSLFAAVGSSAQYFNMRVYLTWLLTMATNDEFSILYLKRDSPSVFASILGLKRTASGYQLRFYEYNDSGLVGVVNIDVIGNEHYVEINLQKASSSVSGNGIVRVRVDNQLAYENTSNQMYTRFETIDSSFLGVVSGLDVGTSGDMWFGRILITDDADQIGPYVSYNARAFSQLRRRRRE